MRNKLLSAFGVLALAVTTLVGLQAQPAQAHVYDSTAAWVCGATRPASNWTVIHAYPDYLTPNWLEEVCIAHLVGHQDIYWHSVYSWSPPPAYIYRASSYLDWYGAPPG